ncbi:MAG TPA: putative DNA modification/repair radical SAM protein [Myxococcota bacterium]|nr:putative DNA modification/repair radical SAM protein [Myxococcota bacterium]
MDVRTKLAILADAAKYDASCASSGGRRNTPRGGVGNVEGMGICHSYTPDGRCVSLLKILLTNYCIFDCSYCINRVSSPVRRARFSIEEVVSLTLDFYRRNYIEGLFLSSGVIKSPDDTMEQLAEIARRLREEHRFGGYIHLKAVAGCSSELITKAGRHADRLSANIELPTQRDLDTLAPAKRHVEVEGSMSHIKAEIDASSDARRASRRAPAFAPAGQSTQMVVGASATSDLETLRTADKLYKEHGLRRVYYSAFSPIPHGAAVLPLVSPPLVREHRLYQADWLLRYYDFTLDELADSFPNANLNLSMDPKLAWALRHREHFPVDVNTASKRALLRVPGFGARNVERILQTRRRRRLRLDDLRKLRVSLARAKFFIVTADTNPAVRALDSARLLQSVGRDPQQLPLFAALSARDGEL